MSTELHTLSGAYAIDALSPDDAEAFRTHLAECPACCDEVRELRHAAGLMGASEALLPPAALKARVLAAADQVPQLPPRVTRIEKAKGHRWAPRLAAAAAAVVLLVGGVIGIGQLTHHEQPVVAASVSRVFQAPDAHKATVSTANGGKVTLATSHGLNQMAVETDRLPGLSKRQVYQLWAIHDGAMTSVGVLTDLGAGKAMALPGAGTEVAITIEPAGGSTQPTTAPIVRVDPAAV